jgi:hypothetical protein
MLLLVEIGLMVPVPGRHRSAIFGIIEPGGSVRRFALWEEATPKQLLGHGIVLAS